MNKGVILRGRQILNMLYGHYKLDEASGALFSFEDLLAIQLVDDDLERPQTTYDTVASGMAEVPAEDARKRVSLRMLNQSAHLKEASMHQYRMDVTLRTHDYLYQGTNSWVVRKHHKEFREAQQAAMSGETGNAALAAKVDDDLAGSSREPKT